jgi:hypothetical protein
MYSAVSIIEELKESKEIEYECVDAICCPRSDPSCEKWDDCSKGIGQICKQRINIFRDYKLLIVLTVRFRVTPDRREGFIRKDDSRLTQLTIRGYLDKERLKMA